MKFSISSLYTRVLLVLVLVVCVIALSEPALAQTGGLSAVGASNNSQANLNSQQWLLRMTNTTVDSARLDPKELSAYKAFYAAQGLDKRIELGQRFLQKYPSSLLAGAVYAELVQTYYTKQDWTNFYASADRALTISPDNVDVLTTVGWVIPHVADPNGPGADKDLDRAERYEKHAIEIIAKMTKPAGITDAQFGAFKDAELSEAHSGLGLVYFRRQDFEGSVMELQQSTQGAATPDATDLFVLGRGLQNLHRNREAADAFGRCAQIPGSLQGQCKQSADALMKLAEPSK
jgi:tetratricopeptide (TPR) repeat protein